MADPLALAEKVEQMATDALGPLARATKEWPAEYREIIWQAVALTAARYQHDAIVQKVGK